MGSTGRVVALFIAFLAGNAASAQEKGKHAANQPTDQKNEFLVVPEPFTIEVYRNYHTVAFSPDGTRLVSVGRNRGAMIWQAANGKEFFSLPSSREETYDVAFSPDGKWIASGARKGAKLWNAVTGVEIFTTRGQNWVNRVSFSPDCKRLATAG